MNTISILCPVCKSYKKLRYFPEINADQGKIGVMVCIGCARRVCDLRGKPIYNNELEKILTFSCMFKKSNWLRIV